jgi:hypothetical protein
MPIKSFRGQLANDGTDTISLHTNNGSTGYKIVKLQIIDGAPGTLNCENLLQIHKINKTVDGTVDFSDNTLLGVAFRSPQYSSGMGNIIFDNEVFNQDIYLFHKDISGNAAACNYYIELEVMKLALDENTVATLKDIRNIQSNE